MTDFHDVADESTIERTRSRGATAVEYALIIALIAAIVITAITQLGSKTEGLYDKTNTEMVNEGL